MIIAIPPSIEIAGVEYDVRFVEELDAGHVAQIHFLDGTIYILDSLCPEVAFVSLMHECQHGVFAKQNIFPNEKVIVDEDIVERSAQIWTQIFKQILEYNFTHEIVPAPREEDEMPEMDILNIGVDFDEIS